MQEFKLLMLGRVRHVLLVTELLAHVHRCYEDGVASLMMEKKMMMMMGLQQRVSLAICMHLHGRPTQVRYA